MVDRMTSHFISGGERAVNTLPDALPDTLAGRLVGGLTGLTSSRPAPRDGRLNGVLGATVAILNQTQSDLEASRKQITALKEQICELEKLATTDLLTGIKNRLGFEQAFCCDMDRVKRGKSIGGVLVVIDLDSFKAINDTYGHQAGDACLKLVGGLLAKEIRPMDTAARLGGDEFVLILTEATPDILLTRVQNIAWKLNHLILRWNDQNIDIHASVGMKPYRKGDTPEAIFAEADRSMYCNKKHKIQ